MRIEVMVTGRDYHTADAMPESIDLADGGTVDDAIAALRTYLAEGQTFPESCLVAVSGEHLGTIGGYHNRPLREGDEITLIAPVAGG